MNINYSLKYIYCFNWISAIIIVSERLESRVMLFSYGKNKENYKIKNLKKESRRVESCLISRDFRLIKKNCNVLHNGFTESGFHVLVFRRSPHNTVKNFITGW